jgi:hypothetical protein
LPQLFLDVSDCLRNCNSDFLIRLLVFLLPEDLELGFGLV